MSPLEPTRFDKARSGAWKGEPLTSETVKALKGSSSYSHVSMVDYAGKGSLTQGLWAGQSKGGKAVSIGLGGALALSSTACVAGFAMSVVPATMAVGLPLFFASFTVVLLSATALSGKAIKGCLEAPGTKPAESLETSFAPEGMPSSFSKKMGGVKDLLGGLASMAKGAWDKRGEEEEDFEF